MAQTITQVSQLYDAIDFANNDFEEVDLDSSVNDFYLIALKGDGQPTDIVPVSEVTSITFEIGIESGATGKYITIARPIIDFTLQTSSDEDLDTVSGYIRLLNIPSKFFIRVLSINTVNKQYSEGEIDIEVNINPVALGAN